MGPEFFNIYVEKLILEITELTKTKVLMAAQLSYYEKINSDLAVKVEELEKALNKANSKSKKNESTSDF